MKKNYVIITIGVVLLAVYAILGTYIGMILNDMFGEMSLAYSFALLLICAFLFKSAKKTPIKKLAKLNGLAMGAFFFAMFGFILKMFGYEVRFLAEIMSGVTMVLVYVAFMKISGACKGIVPKPLQVVTTILSVVLLIVSALAARIGGQFLSDLGNLILVEVLVPVVGIMCIVMSCMLVKNGPQSEKVESSEE